MSEPPKASMVPPTGGTNKPKGWLNRTVAGAGLTSALSSSPD